MVNNNKDNDDNNDMTLTKSNSTLGFKVKHSVYSYNWDVEVCCKNEKLWKTANFIIIF